jgi:hypothetical protein
MYQTLFSAWLLLLVGGQIQMLLSNSTTNEALKKKQDSYYSENPYDLGWLKNLDEYLNNRIDWRTAFTFSGLHSRGIAMV